MNRFVERSLIAAALVVAAGSTALAQGQAFDRTRPPPLRPPARIKMPPVVSATLANGLKLYVVEMHEVPLVQFTLTVAGGGR